MDKMVWEIWDRKRDADPGAELAEWARAPS